MSKIRVSIGSFILGALLTSALNRFGTTISIFAQPERLGVVSSGSEPAIPPLRHNVVSNYHLADRTQPLDGFECENCSFRNVKFTYAGGAVRLVNPKINGPFTLELKGPAANTVGVIQYLQAIGNQQRPAPLSPNSPIIRTASAKATFTEGFVTPYGGN